jgi:hypothetical protein
VFATTQAPGGPNNSTLTSLVGIDSATGGLKFSVPVDTSATGSGFLAPPMIAGDGYAYLPYATRTECGGGSPSNRLFLLRVSSSGAASSILVTSWVSTCSDVVPVSVAPLITNGDTGALMSFETNTDAHFGLGTISFYLATTNGLGVSLSSAPVLPGQEGPVEPRLQAEDGSFVGVASVPGGDQFMVAFNGSGGVRWAVRGQSPLVVRPSGEVLAESGLRFGGDGMASTLQRTAFVQSWGGLWYGATSSTLRRVIVPPIGGASASYWAYEGGNPSRNRTAVAGCPCLFQRPNQSPGSSPEDLTTEADRVNRGTAFQPERPAVGETYLLLEADPGENRGPGDNNNMGFLFNYAALTQRTGILNRGGIVDLPKRVSSVQAVAFQLVNNGTISGSVYLFSHGGELTDGSPAIFVGESARSASNPDPNLYAGNVLQLSNLKLAPSAQIFIYACHGGRGGEYSIAQQIANRLKRWVWASRTGMFFSSSPTVTRPASLVPSFSGPPVYMVPWGGYKYDSLGNLDPNSNTWRLFLPRGQ